MLGHVAAIEVRAGRLLLECYLDLLLGEVIYRQEVLVMGLRVVNVANAQLSVVRWLLEEVPVARQVWVQPLSRIGPGLILGEVAGTKDSPRSASLTAFMLRNKVAKAAGPESFGTR